MYVYREVPEILLRKVHHKSKVSDNRVQLGKRSKSVSKIKIKANEPIPISWHCGEIPGHKLRVCLRINDVISTVSLEQTSLGQ